MPHDETLRQTERSVASTSVPSSSAGAAVTWAWGTHQGAAEWASTEQLRRWLARGILPPSILVWKPGWSEWLPAREVAELAAPSPPTLSPHAIDLAVPVLRAPAPAPEQPSQRQGGRGWLGTVIVGAVAVLSVGSSWAAFSLAMRGLQQSEPAPPQRASSAQPVAGAGLPPPSPPAEPVREPAVLRVDDLPTKRSRAQSPARATAGRRGSARR
jgi:hypothetical protein